MESLQQPMLSKMLQLFLQKITKNLINLTAHTQGRSYTKKLVKIATDCENAGAAKLQIVTSADCSKFVHLSDMLVISINYLNADITDLQCGATLAMLAFSEKLISRKVTATIAVQGVISQKVLSSAGAADRAITVATTSSAVAVPEFSTVAGDRLVAELEHLTGLRSIILIDPVYAGMVTPTILILGAAFKGRFYSYMFRYNLPASTLYYNILFLFLLRDADAFLKTMRMSMEQCRFAIYRSMFQAIRDGVTYVWHFSHERLGAVGLYMTFSGKLGRRLLVQASSEKCRLGITGNSSGVAAIFRYSIVVSATGVFGFSIYYYYDHKQLF